MIELMNLHDDGVFLRREALAFGYNDAHLRAACRERVIARVRQGAYVSAAAWQAADALEQFRLKGRAVLLTHGGRVALSHTSAAGEHGLTLFRPDLSTVHVTRLDGQHGRNEAGVRHHLLGGRPADVVPCGEALLVDPVNAALGTASLHDVESGVVVLDSLLELGLADQDMLWVAYGHRSHHPGSRHLQVVVRLARPGAQSGLESRVRYFMFCFHVPEPVLQYAVHNEHGVLLGVTDMAWPERRMLGEVDGKIKYGRALRPGQPIEDVLFEEKKREDLLRETTGFGMIRYIAADLHDPLRTSRRTYRALGLRDRH